MPRPRGRRGQEPTLLELSTLLFAIAAVALLSTPSVRALGAAAALLCILAAVRTWGPSHGLLVTLTLAMTSTSVLGLQLPPRPRVAWPLGLISGALGLSLFVVQGLA